MRMLSNNYFSNIPDRIRTMTLARDLRWFGWGLCETLVPVLIFSFSHTYVDAGIYRSIYDIVFLISLPVVSILADRIPAKNILLFALAIYPLVGLSYFLAGALGLAFPIIIARSINGVGWCCDNVGGNTYLRRYASKIHLSSTFGYLEASPNLFWMLAALISIPFLHLIPIHYLFLAIIPTSFMAFLLLLRLPSDRADMVVNTERVSIGNTLKLFKRIPDCKKEIWILGWLAFFIGCMEVMATFFLPLFVFSEGGNLAHVVIISSVFAIPSILAFWLGKFIDPLNKKNVIIFGFIIMAILLWLVSLTTVFALQVGGIFILGIILVSMDICVQSLITLVSHADHYGRMGGLMSGANTLGNIIAPVAIGLVADGGGMASTFIFLAVMSLITVFVSALFRFSNVSPFGDLS